MPDTEFTNVDELPRVDSQRSIVSGRSVFSRGIKFTKSSEPGVENEKGPLGLTTIYSPSNDVEVDVIFVHGLGGGSRKTWSKNENPALFWPKEWLSQDPDFRNVRIHTFGYDSNWGKESIHNIHDFAKSLLEWTRDAPTMQQDIHVPLILVCHSLGGLVAKRAYILARQLHEYNAFAQRLQAIFFLATPHRGSNLAETLTKILQVASGARPYVTDLHPNSSTIQSINEEFPHHCSDLHLYSFYENTPMSFNVKKVIIVPKDSATLGYANERTNYLNANHREVCKYLSPEDPNYVAVRNALASVVVSLKSTSKFKNREIESKEYHWLSDTLEADDDHNEDYERVVSLRIDGSCNWIAERASFQKWRDSAEPTIYWLTAKPGTGKSVLAGRVIEHLRELNHNCAFYFFSHGDKTKSSVGAFLKSIAWQMSLTSNQVSASLIKIFQKEPQLAKADFRTLWRRLFLEGIFRIKLPGCQYWIVDALDECRNVEVVSWLLKAAETGMIRIFLTCRNRLEFYGEAIPKKLQVLIKTIPQESTSRDIALFLDENFSHLPALSSDTDSSREMTRQVVLEKSAGCFLWVKLVLQELRSVHTASEVRQVLQDVPSDMDELYNRILYNMSRLPHGKKLAAAILSWVVCAARPLTVEELHHALQIDINDHIDSIERSIVSTCGQLVFIDTSSHVQMIHQTARDYLLRSENTSEFAIEKRDSHRRLLMTCLLYLNSSEMSAPKPRKLSANTAIKERSAFVAYASKSWCEHITFAPSEDDDIVTVLAKFLSSPNVLAWVEYIAAHGSLVCLVRSGRALRNLLQRRSKHAIQLGREVSLLDAWSVDLVRLVTKFGTRLSSSPSSIYHLIPPFCPLETAVRKQFGNSGRSIIVSGLSAKTWDDCSSTISFQQGTPSALACSHRGFAIALNNGDIKIYGETTYEPLVTVSHGQAAKLLKFGHQGDVLASASLNSICLWDAISWEQLWKCDTESSCMSLRFADNDRLLLTVQKANQIFAWNVATGFGEELGNWLEEFDDASSGHFRRPIATAFTEDSSHLAVSYRGHDVLIWNIEEETIYDIYGQDTGSLGCQSRRRPGVSTIWTLEYSRAPESRLLAAACNDGGLVVFNTAEGSVQASVTAANVKTLASSPDGLTLAGGNSSGIIQLFDFETLKLLYRIQSEEFGIKDLAFSVDSQRLIDIRGPHCRVWDPSVLVRQELSEDVSDATSISTTAQEYRVDDARLEASITALACAESLNAVFCGTIDGSVLLYDSKNGQRLRELFRHAKGVSISSLDFNISSCILFSADSASRVMIHFIYQGTDGLSAKAKSLGRRIGISIDQLISNPSSTRLLISSATTDILWSLESDEPITVTSLDWQRRKQYRWMSHPANSMGLLLITDNAAHVYEWASLTRLTPKKGVILEGSVLPELAIRSVIPVFDAQVLATTFAESLGSRSKAKLLLWNIFDFTVDSTYAIPIPHYQPLADQVGYLVGISGRRIVFVHKDGWLCSADSHNFDVDKYDRHFFFPADWLSTAAAPLLEIYENGNVAFVLHDELAIIKRGLEHFEKGQSKAYGKRPPRTGSKMFSSTVSTISKN